MKRIYLVALCFSQACFGITPDMLAKFKKIYNHNFTTERIANESGLTLTDFIISLAALDPENVIPGKLANIEIIKATGLKGKLNEREQKDWFDIIKK